MIRPAQPGDGPALKKIQDESVRTLCRNDYSPEHIAVWTAGPNEQYEQNIQTCPLFLVYEDSDTLLGYICLKRNLSIWQLYVHPKATGQGIGKALLEAAEAYIFAKGCDRAIAHASLTAINFYEHCGYRVVEHVKTPIGNLEFDAITVEKIRPPSIRLTHTP